MWRETPYVIIGAHEPGLENKLIACGKSKILSSCHECLILERDPDTGKPTGEHMRILFCNPEVMRRFGELIKDAARAWETGTNTGGVCGTE